MPLLPTTDYNIWALCIYERITTYVVCCFFLTGKIKNKTDYEHEGATSYSTGSIRLAYSWTVWRKEYYPHCYSVRTRLFWVLKKPSIFDLKFPLLMITALIPLLVPWRPLAFTLYGRIESRHIGRAKMDACCMVHEIVAVCGVCGFSYRGWLPSPQGWVDRRLAGAPPNSESRQFQMFLRIYIVYI